MKYRSGQHVLFNNCTEGIITNVYKLHNNNSGCYLINTLTNYFYVHENQIQMLLTEDYGQDNIITTLEDLYI